MLLIWEVGCRSDRAPEPWCGCGLLTGSEGVGTAGWRWARRMWPRQNFLRAAPLQGPGGQAASVLVSALGVTMGAQVPSQQ